MIDLHNFMRWLVLLSAVYALVANYRGWLGHKPFDKRSGLVYTTILHIQLVVAITMYCSSPLVHAAWADMKAAMWQRELRFFSIEHPLQMLIAIAVATIGYGRAKRRESYKIAALSYTVSLVLILTAIPWPFSSHPRRWFPV